MPLIREVNVQDIPKIENLELRVFGAGGHTAVSLRQLLDLFPSFLLVAENENVPGEISGYSVGAISQCKGRGWILAVASDPNSRQRGVGRALTEELLHRLRRHRLEEIFLTVASDNTPARSLYAKLGFIEKGVIDNYFCDGKSRILMSRTVDGASC